MPRHYCNIYLVLPIGVGGIAAAKALARPSKEKKNIDAVL
jgi:hypothetical protein